MRLTNRNRSGLYTTLFTLINVVLILGIALVAFDTILTNRLGILRFGLLVFGLLLLALIHFRGRPVFEYDSDGEALNFRNYSPFPLLFKKESRDEFPKYKFLSFEIINLVLARFLYVKISSRKSPFVTLKYDISYLSSKEVSDLKASLTKIEKTNLTTEA